MSFTPPPVVSKGPDLDKREISDACRLLGQGRSNAGGEFTLTANVASTVVNDENIASDSAISWAPKTANAAAEIATMYVSTQTDGSFTVTHANNAQLDRTFSYVIQG